MDWMDGIVMDGQYSEEKGGCAAPEDLKSLFKALMFKAADQLDTVETFPDVRNKEETSLRPLVNIGCRVVCRVSAVRAVAGDGGLNVV